MNALLPTSTLRYTLADIANVLSLHKTSVMRRSEKEAWPFEEESVRGGKKRFYALIGLPKDIQSAIQQRAMAAALPVRAHHDVALDPAVGLRQAPARRPADDRRCCGHG